MRCVRTRPVNGRSANLRFPFGMRNKSDMMQETTSTLYSLDRLSPLEGTAGASAAAVNRRGRGGRAAALTSTLVAMVAMVVALMAVAAPTANAAEGEHFSFAPVTDADSGSTAAAFPGQVAFWAGVCDLHAGGAAVGSPPVDRGFPGCIEQPASDRNGFEDMTQVSPPFAVGVSPGTSPRPDGWRPVAPSWRLADVTQAGGRPDGSASFWFSRSPNRVLGTTGQGLSAGFGPDGQPRDIRVSLPAGVIGNPNGVSKCPAEDVDTSPVTCHPKTQVGVSVVAAGHVTAAYPVYNVEPRDGKTAELIISGVGLDKVYDTNAPVIASARTNGDFGVDAEASWIPSVTGVHGQTFTIWGVPWAESHDKFRPIAGYCGTGAVPGSNAHEGGTAAMQLTGLTGGFDDCSQEPQSHDPSWGSIRPFLTTQTECATANPVTSIFADNYHSPVTATAASPAPRLTGCEDIQFDPTFELEPSSKVADSPSGLSVELKVPQNELPPRSTRFNADDDDPDSAVAYWKSTAGLARSHLKDSVVTLPAGFALNPSAATGLAGCPDAQIGVTNAASNPLVFNDGDPFNKDGGADGAECPDGSILGTAEVTTPLLEEKLTGEVVLGEAKSTDPKSGAMFRLFIVVRNRERGLVAKIHGTTTADGVVGGGGSGQLAARFENNPRVPFSNLKLSFKGGSRGVLAMQQRCNTEPDQYESVSSFTPWSRSHLPPGEGDGTQDPVEIRQSWTVDGDCSYDFNPGLKAGMSNAGAREGGTFGFEFTRPQGDQTLKGLTAELPTGLLATVKDLPLCKDAQAAAGNCPAASRIGLVDASAGSGDPFVLEQKGEIFLTEGYKGGAYGLMVKVRAIAGPFRGAMELSPIIVRQKIEVDPTTAQVKAISDPFPTVWHGVPLRVRRVLVNVDRPNFMINPSDCSGKQVKATLTSAEGTVRSRTNHFQSSECASLAFKPKLALRLTGRKQIRTGKHPGIRAVVTQKGVSEAGIKKAEVRLPKSLALDVNNAGALCEFVDGTKPDLEKHCPKGSIVGRSRATSPLLDRPLVGNVYFVKNVRRDPKTGNEIRTLPMIIVALRGEISINLRGESAVDNRNRLVSTFASVPDAPVSRFNLNIRGGGKGIIAVTRTRRALINLCARPKSHVAESDMDGFNGRRHDNDIRMKTPCSKKQTRNAKRAAKKAAKRAAAARHRRS
jgi:hypothetical protein